MHQDLPIHAQVLPQILLVLIVCLDMSLIQLRIVQEPLQRNIRSETVPFQALCVYIPPSRTFPECHYPHEQALHNFDALACPTNRHVDLGIDA